MTAKLCAEPHELVIDCHRPVDERRYSYRKLETASSLARVCSDVSRDRDRGDSIDSRRRHKYQRPTAVGLTVSDIVCDDEQEDAGIKLENGRGRMFGTRKSLSTATHGGSEIRNFSACRSDRG